MILSLNLRERLWLGPWRGHATHVARRGRGMARAVPRSSRGAGTGAGWRCRAFGKAGTALALWCGQRPAQGTLGGAALAGKMLVSPTWGARGVQERSRRGRRRR